MKVLIIIVAILAFPISGMCDFLTADCSQATDNVTSAQLQFGTSAAFDIPVATTCGTPADRVACAGTQRTLCYDTSAMATGSYTVKAAWKNSVGVSPWSVPFTFAVSKFLAPSGVRSVK